ncbi:sialomucin core protein 24 isoform X2 [Sphaerodactylus townsendi]|uniref:sialomucin core protein 24 isoform X2 n=1 Tax=Sphaerodactylus townsendi TaxID=933632 RepID=UPI002026FDF3|nr:sialomucin core protein 24 isoform X2 [Sphaerodactylus townsendi]
MTSRRPSAPLGLAMLLVLLASCFTYLNGVAAGGEEADCTNRNTCLSCLNSTFKPNVTCLWLKCEEEKLPTLFRCTNQTKNSSCIIYEDHQQCLAIPNGTTAASPTIIPPTNTTGSPTPGNTTATTHQVTSNRPKTTVITTTVPGTQSPRKSTFDASSFIGGIVLVLGLQAVIFFLYKFCKSKDQNYHTL